MSTAILKNQLSGETVRVTRAKGKTQDGRILDVWIDANNNAVCVVGSEQPAWFPLSVNGQPTRESDAEKPLYPFGSLSR